MNSIEWIYTDIITMSATFEHDVFYDLIDWLKARYKAREESEDNIEFRRVKTSDIEDFVNTFDFNLHGRIRNMIEYASYKHQQRSSSPVIVYDVKVGIDIYDLKATIRFSPPNLRSYDYFLQTTT